MIEEREKARQELLERLRGAKDQAARNKLGQFATPASLASDIVRHALSLLGQGGRIRFLEPGFGTGAFYSALRQSVPASRIDIATGYEIDRDYVEPSIRLWSGTGLHLHHTDFTQAEPPEGEGDKYNLVVCNPPYVRHHHMDSSHKQELQALVSQRLKFQMNGLSGLYTYFMVLSQAWMSKGGIGVWLVPSEFMDVNYGRKVKEFLVDRVTLYRIHRFDPNEAQFEDALVSSVVVFFTNALPTDQQQVEFSFGGTLDNPRISTRIGLEQLRTTPKWTRLPRLAADNAPEDGSANVYLMLYPKPRLTGLLQDTPELTKAVWKALSSVTSESLIGHGRTYGGGLHKLEPKELANLPTAMILDVLPTGTKVRSQRQLSLFGT